MSNSSMSSHEQGPGAALPSSLTASVTLNGVFNREALTAACKELAGLLAGRLRCKGLAYLEVALEAETEKGTAGAVSRFGHGRLPADLALHLMCLLPRLGLCAPVERLTATVRRLVPAPVEQPALFGGEEHLRRLRLERVLAEVNQKHRLARASALVPDRRERMLAFYDPWRFGGRSDPGPWARGARMGDGKSRRIRG